eukprot:1141096-Prymnesium_polylepis.1
MGSSVSSDAEALPIAALRRMRMKEAAAKSRTTPITLSIVNRLSTRGSDFTACFHEALRPSTLRASEPLLCAPVEPPGLQAHPSGHESWHCE